MVQLKQDNLGSVQRNSRKRLLLLRTEVANCPVERLEGLERGGGGSSSGIAEPAVQVWYQVCAKRCVGYIQRQANITPLCIRGLGTWDTGVLQNPRPIPLQQRGIISVPIVPCFGDWSLQHFQETGCIAWLPQGMVFSGTENYRPALYFLFHDFKTEDLLAVPIKNPCQLL